MPILHSSGGLLYHLRAWRYRRGLWEPFLDQVRRWLTDWRPETRHLVLVGPSGGYALTRQFLERFPHITVLEPDPLARHLLGRRFPDVPFRHDRAPWLAGAEGFRRLAGAYPDAAFLFCNLLGQRPVGAPRGFDHRAWLDGLAPGLAGRAWASWHDLASTATPPDWTGWVARPRAEPLEQVMGRFWHRDGLEVEDHECDGLCPALPREYTVWPLRRRSFHLVEWLRDEASTAAGAPRAVSDASDTATA